MSGPEPQFLLGDYLYRAAQLWPKQVAIRDIETEVTFEQLYGQVKALAGTLGQEGMLPGDRVAIVLPKTRQAVVSLFAVLRAGGVFVPIEPVWPETRKREVIAACGARLAITDSPTELTEACSPACESRLCVLDTKDGRAIEWCTALRSSRTVDSRAVNLDETAYILFTSGSTGKPKGVTISHRAAKAFVEWSCVEFRLSEKDRLACPSSLGFDLSTFDVFNMAVSGATLVLLPQEIVWKPRMLTWMVSDLGVTAWYSVPSLLSLMLAQGDFSQNTCKSLRSVLFAGEPMPMKHCRALRDAFPTAELANLYGPTETNVITFYRLPRDQGQFTELPIGVPCPYAELRIAGLPEKGVAEEGELLASGPSVMSGYWDRGEESASVLIKLSDHTGKQRLYYRTGDRVSYREGNYFFHGRIDRQVKGRGYRIELGEIEAVLNRHAMIRQAAVVAHAAASGQILITAWVEPTEAGHASATPDLSTDLKLHCSAFLPSYMAPDRIMILPSIPHNSRAKTDYPRLTEMAKKG